MSSDAQRWLEDHLEQQGCPGAGDVMAEGEAAGYSEATLREAAESLGVVQEGTGWKLPISFYEKAKARWDAQRAMSTAVREYLDAVLGDTEGWCCAGSGVPYWKTKPDGTRVIEHTSFMPCILPWPAQADTIERWILAEAATRDTWVCPYVHRAGIRSLGGSVLRRLAHADIDGTLNLDDVHDLGGFAVATGQPGHAHLYVPLSEPVSVYQHQRLCEGLRDHLGGDDKIRDNDLLRPVGTLNHKIPLLVPGAEPAPVEWLVKP